MSGERGGEIEHTNTHTLAHTDINNGKKSNDDNLFNVIDANAIDSESKEKTQLHFFEYFLGFFQTFFRNTL